MAIKYHDAKDIVITFGDTKWSYGVDALPLPAEEFKYERPTLPLPYGHNIGPIRVQFVCTLSACEVNRDRLYLQMQVPDRDTGRPTTIEVSVNLPLEWKEMEQKMRARWIRYEVLKMLKHELDEGILLGEDRIFDPHVDLKG